MAPNLRLNAVAFVSPLNYPILIRVFDKQDELKYHYIAHTSLDIFEERVNSSGKTTDCYLGLLYAMEDVAVYGYITPLKAKITLAIALTDAVIKDTEIMTIFKAFHMAYYSAICNPFLKLGAPIDSIQDHSTQLLAGSPKWKNFRRHVDEINRIISHPNV